MISSIFRRVRTVAEADTDLFGHVNNVVWVRLVVELAQAHSHAVGLDPEAYRRIGGVWIVRRHELDYHAPAAPRERIVEETWVEELRGARSIRRSRFTREDDARELVTAVTQWAYVDARTLRPRRIDAEVFARFADHRERPR
jgi:acyl-CoA thioester hydrolase